MKLREYLIEEYDDDNFNDIISIIKKDCKKYIKELISYDKILFRGLDKLPRNTSSIRKNFWKVKPRKDRTPGDTPEELHNYLDLQFKKKFGWKARSEGVFCSRSRSTTYNYGSPYFVFPIGDYKYLYSNKITDLFVHFDDSDFHPFALSILRDDAFDTLKQWETTWNNYMIKYGSGKRGQWLHKGIPTGENNYNTILKKLTKDIDENDVDAKNQIRYQLEWKPGIEYEEFIKQEVENERQKLYDHIDEILKTYKTTNLRDASLKTEIMIKCNEYYIMGMKTKTMSRESLEAKVIRSILQD
jgi:hypothetical protein